MSIIYRPYRNNDFDALVAMVKNLYVEDPGSCRINDRNLKNTVDELCAYPGKGRIVVFELEQEPVGYALLINYWSNEYGGNIIIIDELYVIPAQRRKGYASRFLKFLRAEEGKTSRGIQLEVGKKNKNARRVYERNGFKPVNNQIMFYDFNSTVRDSQ